MMKLLNNKFSLFLLGGFLGFFVLIILSAWLYISSFSKASNLSLAEISTIVREGFKNKDLYENKKITFLVLGLDKRQDILESTLLTDTIILASLDTKTSQITMLPIPRDLWIHELKTKVNALYFYGGQRDGTTGSLFIQKELERITGTPIDYYLVMNYYYLDFLVDLAGGIEVDIKQSFIDDQYPNSDYLSDQSKPIYKTVQFSKGIQNLNGKKALEYVRSRHAEGEEGSDNSRSKRQVQVFNGIINRLSRKSLLFEPKRLGLLYRFWDELIETNLANSEVLSIGLNINTNEIKLDSISIPTGIAGDPNAVLVNPPIYKYGLWVLEPADPSWSKLKEFITSKIE